MAQKHAIIIGAAMAPITTADQGSTNAAPSVMPTKPECTVAGEQNVGFVAADKLDIQSNHRFQSMYSSHKDIRVYVEKYIHVVSPRPLNVEGISPGWNTPLPHFSAVDFRFVASPSTPIPDMIDAPRRKRRAAFIRPFLKLRRPMFRSSFL